MDVLTIGVDIAHDRSHTSIVAAGRLEDGNVAIELTYVDGSDTVDDVKAVMLERKPSTLVIDPRSPAATLLAPLRDWIRTASFNADPFQRPKLVEPTTHDVAVAHGRFLDEFKAGRIRYVPHPALSLAVQHAIARPLAGAEALERRKVDVDASPFTAAEAAVWGILDAPQPIDVTRSCW